MRYITDEIVLELDLEKCTGCGFCIDVCPHEVFTLRDGKARITDRGACMQCGACSKNCRFGALKTESGVGCAAAIVMGAILGTEPTCGGDSGGSCCCSGPSGAGNLEDGNADRPVTNIRPTGKCC
jgi:NAD-dependent dihydropyrimidine dehydrogenase PreA subunit